MATEQDLHLQGVLRLIDPNERERAKRLLATPKGRQKWLGHLLHHVSMHADFTNPLGRGERGAEAALLKAMALGAPKQCYVFASDAATLDDTFQPLEEFVRTRLSECGHGTILSCIPGRLAIFRSAGRYEHSVVWRPD